MELNREQIVKALECCASPKQMCKDCPMPEEIKDDCRCMEILSRNAVALIRELTEENERLERENARYEAENNAEFNKWLKLEEATKRHHKELFQEAKIAVRDNTVRKMQERLKKAFNFGYIILEKSICDIIDQIAKELLEEET